MWKAYEELDPFGNDRLDYLAGTIAATIQNLLLPQGEKPVEPMETVPDWGGIRALEELERKKAARRDVADDWREYGELSRRLVRGDDGE